MLSNKVPIITLKIRTIMNKSFWLETINIGSLSVPRFMAAPLDGVTDSPLRQLIREFSPDELLMTEMRHVAQVANERKETCVSYNPLEKPLAFQFSANQLTFIEESVEKVIQHGFCMINLNCGCPAKNVTKSGSGSALMANLPQLEKLLRHFYSVIKGRVPFTIKIRAGFKERNAVEVAQLAEDCGVASIMIHPRTQPEGFVSRLDFDLAAQVKKKVAIPVIFSGNVNNFGRAVKTYEATGVDGFMIGRALWGAPWKLREIVEESQGNQFNLDPITALRYAIKHFELCMKFYGPPGFNIFKKQFPQYIRSISNAGAWRKKILTCTTEQDMRIGLDQLGTEHCLW